VEASFVRQLLESDGVFGLLSETEREGVAACLTPLSFQAGETVITHGDEASGIYLIAAGKVRITAGNGADDPILTILSQGDCFGEHSMLTHTPISATVQAAEDLELLRLGPADVEALFDRVPDVRQAIERRVAQHDAFNFLRTVKLLSGFSRDEIQALLDVMETQTLAAGDFLFHEGDVADAAFIVRAGTIQVIKESADHAELGRLEPGALLEGTSHSRAALGQRQLSPLPLATSWHAD